MLLIKRTDDNIRGARDCEFIFLPSRDRLTVNLDVFGEGLLCVVHLSPQEADLGTAEKVLACDDCLGDCAVQTFHVNDAYALAVVGLVLGEPTDEINVV